MRPIRITAPWGNIYDRRGELLVTSRFSHVVSVVPEDIKENPYVVRFLSQVLELSEEELFQMMEESAKYQKGPVCSVETGCGSGGDWANIRGKTGSARRGGGGLSGSLLPEGRMGCSSFWLSW